MMFEEVLIQIGVQLLCKQSKQCSGWVVGGGFPPMMFEETMIQIGRNW